MGGRLQVVPVLFNTPSLGFKQAKTKGRYRQKTTGKYQQYLVVGTVGPKLEVTSHYHNFSESQDSICK